MWISFYLSAAFSAICALLHAYTPRVAFLLFGDEEDIINLPLLEQPQGQNLPLQNLHQGQNLNQVQPINLGGFQPDGDILDLPLADEG